MLCHFFCNIGITTEKQSTIKINYYENHQKHCCIISISSYLDRSLWQSGETQKLLANKWIIDTEAMKPSIAAIVATHPQTASLDAAAKEEYTNNILGEMSGFGFELSSNGNFAGAGSEGNVAGKWKLSADSKELTTQTEGKPERKFIIAAVSKTKLHLIGEDSRDMFLKTEN
ncbi:MAG TPA: hypothetical protein VFR70_08795 [Flavobacterium sp.]|nr:hypothetical protein [Flavobacterium sp.]